VTPRKLGILTSGGDAPGMNAAIRAVVRTAATLGIGVVAYRDGFCGLVDDVSTPLDINDVGNILQRGGTIIGTSRCPEFHDPKVRARAVEQMRAAGIDGLIVVGGDGSFRGAHALMAEHDVAVAGLTGTIDNDIPGTDETIGFHTAVDTAVRAIDKVRDTSESTGMMFFIEVMGRTSGAIAVATGVACGAAAVFVPGACESVEAVADLVRARDARGARSHIVIVAEGDELGGAMDVGRQVGTQLDKPYRTVILGHIQRGGSPVARDRIIATWTAERAVASLARGRSGMMAGMSGGDPVEVPLADVFDGQVAPFDDRLLQLAMITSGL
jgi:6-phosphofructokinase 1